MKRNRNNFKYLLQIGLAFGLGVAIIYWIYRDLDFNLVKEVLFEQTVWGWMIASLFFGVMSHVLRGWRWLLALEPLGEYPKKANAVYAIFLSYAANLVIPRLGEFTRCGVLSKYDGISFSKSLGSVVAERFVDTICIMLITVFTLLLQSDLFISFFKETGYKIPVEGLFQKEWFYIFVLSGIGICVLLYLLAKKLALIERAKGVMKNIWEGIAALRKIKRAGLYWFYTLSIWLCYFFHFYLTFYCFSFSNELGVLAGLSLFIVGSIAVIVPTPNGAGPWHFAVITMMVLYGVSKTDAGIFALIVHTIQSFLVVLLGIYGFVSLPLSNKKQ